MISEPRLPLIEHVARYRRAISRVRDFGVTLSRNCRGIAYLTQLDALVGVRDTARSLNEREANALFESSELADAADAIDATCLEADQLRRKLQTAFSGAERYDSVQQPETDFPRNTAWELQCASQLDRLGVLRGFGLQLGDLRADHGGLRAIECKRLASVGGLRERLKAARKNLGHGRRSEGLAMGLVFLDLTRAARPRFSQDRFPDLESATVQALADLDTFIHAHPRDFWSRHDNLARYALGCYCRVSSFFNTAEGLLAIRQETWQFVSLHAANTSLDLEARVIAEVLAGHPLVHQIVRIPA